MNEPLTPAQQRQLLLTVIQLTTRMEELERLLLTFREANLIMTRAGEDFLKLKRTHPSKAEQGRR